MIDGNCPNCGALITGPICEYCGRRFDIVVKDTQKEVDILRAKSETLKLQIRVDEMTKAAIQAMRCDILTANELRRRIIRYDQI